MKIVHKFIKDCSDCPACLDLSIFGAEGYACHEIFKQGKPALLNDFIDENGNWNKCFPKECPWIDHLPGKLNFTVIEGGLTGLALYEDPEV